MFLLECFDLSDGGIHLLLKIRITLLKLVILRSNLLHIYSRGSP